jgi:hypothetical protein
LNILQDDTWSISSFHSWFCISSHPLIPLCHMRLTKHQWNINFVISFTLPVKRCYSVVL